MSQLQSLVPVLWQAASQAQNLAQSAYPEIRCRTGCNDCCKHHGSPITYQAEWEVIRAWLAERPLIFAQAQQAFTRQKQNWQQQLAADEPPSISQALFEVVCPFLDSERCSIYEVRPLTCRAFGNAVLAWPLSSSEEIYTCNPEKDRWEQVLPMSENLRLPQRQELFASLEASGAPRSLLSWLEKEAYESR